MNIRQRPKRVKLRYVLMALAAAAAFSYYMGHQNPATAEVTKAQECTSVIVEDMREHLEIRRALRSAEMEAQEEDYMTELCRQDPRKCR